MKNADKVAHAQQSYYDQDVDYAVGSPHLKHPALRTRMVKYVRSAIETVQLDRAPRVLEIGGGHGTITEHLRNLGADVTVSEMSLASSQRLATRFDGDSSVRVIHDEDGQTIFDLSIEFDLIACISVLHHVPDYLCHVERLSGLLSTGGAFVTFQDPDWYPRRGRGTEVVDKGAYFAWRLTQGDLSDGARTRLRRLRGHYDETMTADMAEYHVVRQGLDEQRIAQLLEGRFRTVELTRYWSTQSAPLQRLGEKFRWQNTFGICATGCGLSNDRSP